MIMESSTFRDYPVSTSFVLIDELQRLENPKFSPNPRFNLELFPTVTLTVTLALAQIFSNGDVTSRPVVETSMYVHCPQMLSVASVLQVIDS